MQKTATIAAGSSAAVLFSGLFVYHSYLRQLYGRFPQFDHKIIRQAYRRTLYKAATGKYGDMAKMTDSEMDGLFCLEVHALNDL